MSPHPLWLLPLVLAGCATTPPPAQVTRFSAAPDVARGSAAPAPGSAPTLEQANYESAVGRELTRLGFVGGDPMRYTYSVDVTRTTRERTSRRSPVTIGIGGGTGGWGGGIGGGVSFGVGGGGSRDTVVTRLSVQMRERASGRVVWEGRAEGVSDATAASVDRLAAALFRDFPGESGRTVYVP